MNKTISAIILAIVSSSALASEPAFFKTIQEAEKYCPSATNLHFYDGEPFGFGTITGEHNGVNFSSMQTPRPDFLRDTIGNINFIQINGYFGSKIDHKIVCEYAYSANAMGIPQKHVTLAGMEAE
jgi:hypothetical protein